MKDRVVRAAVMNRYLHKHVVRPTLGVLDKHIKIAIVFEDAGVE